MRNEDYLKGTIEEELKFLNQIREGSGLSYDELARKMNVDKYWLDAALKGEQWIPDEYIELIAKELDVSIEKIEILKRSCTNNIL